MENLKFTFSVTAIVGNEFATSPWTLVCAHTEPIDSDKVREILVETVSKTTAYLSNQTVQNIAKTAIRRIEEELGYRAVVVPSDVTFRIIQRNVPQTNED